jgi:hypothetical protein
VDALPAAPSLGQHNREVARERLGIDDAQYDSLVERGIFGNAPAKASP